MNMEIDEPAIQSSATSEAWRKAISSVASAVVVLRMTAARAFDTEVALSSTATGFVVDKARGIILTNRHVVMPSPMFAEATFLNGEEMPVYPLYRDPVHDFGFFRFDPAAVQFMKVEEIPLAPEAATVGLDIRVIGNDSGEKLSILAGTIARLDRDAPVYGRDVYNDFNTFYLQAASGTRGGSSGSPVIDCQGRAVALNAGGIQTGSSAYFLPLDRVVRALKILQRGKDETSNGWPAVSIPRGTLQMTLLHKGFDETRRLGLRRETEQLVRQSVRAEETGMLVVESVVPGGPSDNILLPGDVVVRVNGEVVTQFYPLESLLDDGVGNTIDLEVERGGSPLNVTLTIQDLHSITPNYFLEIGDAVLHPLSYQQARNFRFTCGLVYVAEPGVLLVRAGVPRKAIIKKLAGKDISRVEDFMEVYSTLERGARVTLEYMTYTDRHRSVCAVITVDRHEWYAPPQIYTRNDATGLWDTRPAIVSDDTSVIESSKAKKRRVEEGADGIKASLCTLLQDTEDDGDVPSDVVKKADEVIKPSLVVCQVYIPTSYILDGFASRRIRGNAVVVYHSSTVGLVAVDRSTVGVSLSDITLTFVGFPTEIPGQVVFLHPVQNYALVAYDPAALDPAAFAAIRAVELLPDPPLRRGDSVQLVVLDRYLQLISQESVVTSASAAVKIGEAPEPRYRAMNVEVIEIDRDFDICIAGVLADEHGRVRALWATFSTYVTESDNNHYNHYMMRGIPIYAISQILDKIVKGTQGHSLQRNALTMPMPRVRILEAELYASFLSEARTLRLSDEWVKVLMKKDPVKTQVLRVKSCFAGSRVENVLEPGDMILAIDGKPVTSFRDVENACQQLDDEGTDSEGVLRMIIFRNGLELELDVGTDVRDGSGSKHLVNWSGSVLQETHSAVRELGFLPEGHRGGVFVAKKISGSPADTYGLRDLNWIVEVNGKPTPDLQTFINVTKELEHEAFVRVRTVSLAGYPRVLTLKQNLHYWPTWELIFDPESATWRRRTIKALSNSLQAP